MFGSMPGSVCVRLHLKLPRVEGGDPQNGLLMIFFVAEATVLLLINFGILSHI